MRGRHARRTSAGFVDAAHRAAGAQLDTLDAMLDRDRHDYEPGDTRHPMHTDPACRVCGRPARTH